MRNYYNYFTEIEEHFVRRRGAVLLLSTLDWALIDTWREAGIPVAAVLRGIDTAFDKHEARKAKGRMRRINGLAWCAQAVMEAAEEMQEATVGAAPGGDAESSGLEQQRIAAHLASCAAEYRAAAGAFPELGSLSARLDALAAEVQSTPPRLEELERTLSVLEEVLFAALNLHAGEDELTVLREQAARELAPYRSRMKVEQIRQIERQFLHKQLLERRHLPRLSLFYLRQGDS
jgi:hypothetical protein